jgi:hypothetical protein
LDPYVGKYYSIDWIQKNVLMQSEKDIKEIAAQIKKEPAPVDQEQDSGQVTQDTTQQ